MCWEEKVGQLGGIGGILGDNSTYNLAKYRELAVLHNGTISPGSYLNYAEQAIPVLSQLIVNSKKEHRLGIPFIHIGDGVNGITLRGTTLFPATLSMSMAWNMDLYKEVITAMRDEFYSSGINWILGPEVDPARDLRNGRVGEMYGEDPWSNGEYASQFVEIMQEKDSAGHLKVATTIKHYLYGTSAGGVNQASMLGGVNHIFNTLALPYINVFKKVKPASLMPSYAVIDGIPAHTNDYLLKDLLRSKWGFDGVIVSDADAINMLWQTHKTARDRSDAAIQSITAGVELELAIGFPSAYESLALNKTVEGVVRDVNSAVKRLMRLKFELGVFDKDLSVNETELAQVLRSDEHLRINKKISDESLVLLKNDGILPMAVPPKVAVIGPFADFIDTGSYGAWDNAENFNLTFLDAAKAKFGSGNVLHVRGCDFLDQTGAEIDAAIAAAKEAGLAILALGAVSVGWQDKYRSKVTDSEGATHASLKLPGLQENLLAAILASGVPTILLLSGGQPFELQGVAQSAKAIVHTFLHGEFTGRSIVDALTGEVNPSGKLTINFPYSSEIQPVYYNHLLSDWQGASAMQWPAAPVSYLYPFGYGLSYSTFSLSGATVDTSTPSRGNTVTVTVNVQNTGSVTGKQVVQVYFRQAYAKVSLPVKRLIRFTKVELAPGASTTVSFKIPIDDLGYYYNEGYYVDAGDYTLWVGDSSLDSSLNALPITVR
ncbi:glycoside hydrolase superfamily [Truncatella angustata]|uniref:beta-glucosidase n=1 Tax=Truncatella angustata TaxID=152316 RepID=A0A9P8UGA5_9PEZI|nr:glycoside hydrolase superfamily [Truncatella angustata]KAH6651507.1 glycoside hydrolase superfamily [Truncatella angustata]